jgi:hypothetical protein
MKQTNQSLEQFNKNETPLIKLNEPTKEEEYFKAEKNLLKSINHNMQSLEEPALKEKANEKLTELQKAKNEALELTLSQNDWITQFNSL